MIPGMVGSVTDMAIPHALADALDSTRNPNNKKVSYLTRITLDGFLRGTGFMARIADHEVARLKAEVSLVRLVESSGVKLTKRGADELMGCCPLHADDTESEERRVGEESVSTGKSRWWPYH